jgi:hypothetical protein
MSQSIKTSIVLPEALHWAMKAKAVDRKMSDTAAIREAIEQWIGGISAASKGKPDLKPLPGGRSGQNPQHGKDHSAEESLHDIEARAEGLRQDETKAERHLSELAGDVDALENSKKKGTSGRRRPKG